MCVVCFNHTATTAIYTRSLHGDLPLLVGEKERRECVWMFVCLCGYKCVQGCACLCGCACAGVHRCVCVCVCRLRVGIHTGVCVQRADLDVRGSVCVCVAGSSKPEGWGDEANEESARSNRRSRKEGRRLSLGIHLDPPPPPRPLSTPTPHTSLPPPHTSFTLPRPFPTIPFYHVYPPTLPLRSSSSCSSSSLVAGVRRARAPPV